VHANTKSTGATIVPGTHFLDLHICRGGHLSLRFTSINTKEQKNRADFIHFGWK